MPQVNIPVNIPAAMVTPVTDELCARFDYAGTKRPNETRETFARRMMGGIVEGWLRDQMRRKAEREAAAAAWTEDG
jgi:hypothetical protein